MITEAFVKLETGGFLLPALDFGEGKQGIRLRFAGINGCMKLRLALDSPENDIGVLTAINVHGFPERCEVFTDLDPIAGGHDFYLFPAREIRLISAEFTEENPYDAVSYEPVPEGAVTDNFHDTWAAVDELGRRVKEPEDVHERRSSRQVGILYWS